jgi:biotin carboxyl carrier protein
MTFEIEVGGRLRAVSVERADRPGRFRVTLDGAVHLVDAVRAGEYGVSLLLEPVGCPETGTATMSADVHLTPGTGPGELLAHLAGRTATIALNGRRRRHGSDASGHGTGDVVITAPMPGRVVRVLVSPGDDVDARQGIVVVEAMKMENELRTPRTGRVKDVSVTPGMSVEAGRILSVIE